MANKRNKKNPTSRRLIISAWNPSEIEDMALPPCHCFMQFYVNEENFPVNYTKEVQTSF